MTMPRKTDRTMCREEREKKNLLLAEKRSSGVSTGAALELYGSTTTPRNLPYSYKNKHLTWNTFFPNSTLLKQRAQMYDSCSTWSDQTHQQSSTPRLVAERAGYQADGPTLLCRSGACAAFNNPERARRQQRMDIVRGQRDTRLLQ